MRPTRRKAQGGAEGGVERRRARRREERRRKVDAFYFAFGEHDVYAVIDAPDNVSVAAASLTIGASGAVQTKTVVLLTPEDVDQAAKKAGSYQPPGR